MLLILFFISFLLLHCTFPKFTGDGTEYTKELSSNSGARGYNCGFMWVPPSALKYFAALNKPDYNGSANCGRCVVITCSDIRCNGYNKQIKTMIVDSCPECKSGDLDFSLPAWNDITNNYNPDRFNITWEYADCDGGFNDGNIRMGIDSGANEWYISISIMNTYAGVQSVSYGETLQKLIKLTRRDDNYWYNSLSAKLTTPYYIEFTDLNGNTYSQKFSDFIPGKIYTWDIASNPSSGTSKQNSNNNSINNNNNTNTNTMTNSSSTSTSSNSTQGTTIQSTFNSWATQSLDAFSSPDGARNQNCGFMWLPSGSRKYFTGIGLPGYDDSENCGRCIEVTCADPRRGSYNKKVMVMVTDSCSGCGPDDLNLSLPAWLEVTNNYPPDKLKVTYQYVTCSGDFVEGHIRHGIDKGASNYYASISISNTHFGVKSARIGLTMNSLEELQRRSDNYWYTQLKTPFPSTNFTYYIEFDDLGGNTYSDHFSDYTPNKVYEWSISSKSTSEISIAVSKSNSSNNSKINFFYLIFFWLLCLI